MGRDKYGRETIDSTADEFREEGGYVEIQGGENDPDCVIIIPKEEDND